MKTVPKIMRVCVRTMAKLGSRAALCVAKSGGFACNLVHLVTCQPVDRAHQLLRRPHCRAQASTSASAVPRRLSALGTSQGARNAQRSRRWGNAQRSKRRGMGGPPRAHSAPATPGVGAKTGTPDIVGRGTPGIPETLWTVRRHRHRHRPAARQEIQICWKSENDD